MEAGITSSTGAGSAHSVTIPQAHGAERCLGTIYLNFLYGAVKKKKIKKDIEPGSSVPIALSAVRLHKEYGVQFWASYFQKVEGVTASRPECAD